MPICRGDGKTTAKTMAPVMMLNCNGDFDHCIGGNKSNFDGTMTKRRGKGKLYPNWSISDDGGRGAHHGQCGRWQCRVGCGRQWWWRQPQDQCLGQRPTTQLSFEPTLIHRGDRSTSTRMMAPGMMPNCNGNFDHCNGGCKSNFNGARTTRRDKSQLYPN